MAETRPRTRWKRLAVIAVALVGIWSYAMIAWLSGSVVWPISAADYYLHRAERQKQLAIELMSSVPFDTQAEGGFAGLPGTSIWAKVPQGVFGSVRDTTSNGLFGLRPVVWWRSSSPVRIVTLTTLEAVRAGPGIVFATDSPGEGFWTGLQETAEDIVADAASSGDTKGAYSIELDSPEGVQRRLDVDLEYGVAIIFQWMSEDAEPLDMYEYFTMGEPVPPVTGP